MENNKFEVIDASVKEVLSTIDSKHADVTNAILRANATVCKLKREGMTILNSSELVSTLMKNLTKVKSITGAEKKALVLQLIKEVSANCPEAEMILAVTPGLVDNFCTLIHKKKTLIGSLLESLFKLIACGPPKTKQ